jgi:transcriptional regulator with XRE-family HTH domain
MSNEDTENVTGVAIRRRRIELGLSQAQVAEATGVNIRQIRRYEAGDQQPLLSVGVAIARALRMSVLELVGDIPGHRVDLTGEWWMSWQTSNDGRDQVTAQTVQFMQQDELITMQTTSRGTVNDAGGHRAPLTVEDGGYHWHGELRLWDNRVLIGWYAANDGGVASKGSLYFGLHTHGDNALGIWTGSSHDGDLLSGWGALGRSENDVVQLVGQLKATRGIKALRTAAESGGDPDGN